MKPSPPDDAVASTGNVAPGGTVETAVCTNAPAGVKGEILADFAGLLRDYISHLEDETVLLEVAFPTEQVFKTRSWKDYRSNFTLTSKFLEDVKSGFYPFLGYRFGAVAAEQEEEEEVCSGPMGPVATTTTADWTNHHPLMGSAFSGVISNDASSTTSRKHSDSAISGTETTSHHLSTTHEIPSESPKPNEFSDFSLTTSAPVAASAATSAAVPLVGSARIDSSLTRREIRRHSLPNSFADCVISANQLKQHMQNILIGAGVGVVTASPFETSANVDAVKRPAEANVPNCGGQQIITSTREKRVRQQSTHTCGINEVCLFGSSPQDMNAAATRSAFQVALDLLSSKVSITNMLPAHNLPHTPHASIASTLTQSGALSLASAMAATAANAPISATDACTAEKYKSEDMEGDAKLSDDDDDGQNDSDDDEEEQENSTKGGVRGTDRGYDGTPQVVHVAPPTQPPTTPALFTHCQYTYIGAGRWQVYVQMWFVEERLKREAYVQVLEHEWHDYDRITELFEGSKCLSSSDKNILLRLLALARHNIPLVEGSLVYPCYGSQCNGSVDSQELYSKLVTLLLHQQSQELISQVSHNVTAHEIPSASTSMSSQEQSSVAPMSANPPDSNDIAAAVNAFVDESVDVSSAPSVLIMPPPSAITISSDLCRSSEPPSQHGPGSCPHELADGTGSLDAPKCVNGDPQTTATPLPTQQPTAVGEGGTNTGSILASVVAPTVSMQTMDLNAPQPSSMVVPTLLNDNHGFFEMLDVGALAPHNSSCPFCDRHDYLHRTDLPNYLTCPCYHCRESLAREAKVSPEDLFDLHLQHNIPWPAFLETRFNIPPDGRPLEELIAYDCRWRGREPCICLPDSGPLPPCVELPWFYYGPLSNNATSATPQPPHRHAGHSTDFVSPFADTKTGDDATVQTTTTSPNMATLHPKSLSADNTTTSKHHHSHTITLPCASRHPRGLLGPPQCCDPITRPKDNAQLGVAETQDKSPLQDVISESKLIATELEKS